MKGTTILMSAALAVSAAAGWAQADSRTNANAAIEGVWRCQMHGLPAVTLTVTGEGGSLAGAVLFYLHRSEPDKPETATPGVPEPIFNPRFDGKTLTFQVSHRRAHPPGSLNDGPVTFALKLDTAEKAEFVDENQHDANAPVYVLVRSAY